MTRASFLEFLDIWNQQAQRPTPAVHAGIADWLDDAHAGGTTRLCLMAFRNAGKSSLVGLYCAWLLARAPDLRILVVAAEHSLATAMVANVRAIVERHPLTTGLRPQGRQQWSSDRFTVARPAELREPSMMAKGLNANLTGCRADVIVCDDVEVPNTCDTLVKCAELRRKLGELDYVLVPGGLQLFVGTPHTLYSIYAEHPHGELDERQPYLADFATYRLPLVDAQGRSAWPERFPEAEIARLRTRTGPAKFASQMELRPTSVVSGHLDPDRLGRYTGALSYTEAQGQAVLRIDGVRMVAGCCAWDPAYGGGAGRDRSVLAAVFLDAEGTYWLHRVVYLDDPGERYAAAAPDTPEAVRQCRRVAALLAELHMPVLHLETNGVGRFLPELLKRELSDAGVSASVVAQPSTMAKERRILEALDGPLAAGALLAHESVLATPFLRELREWRPGAGARQVGDDGLDAVASCLLAEPVRLSGRQPRPAGGADWRTPWPQSRAETRFRP